MSHDIEADYRENSSNEDKYCLKCTSHQNGYCGELDQVVEPTASCDFFQVKD